jgi:hypothetical protein
MADIEDEMDLKRGLRMLPECLLRTVTLVLTGMPQQEVADQRDPGGR